MATNSKIERTETTWNPVAGCTKISDGFKNDIQEVETWHARRYPKLSGCCGLS